ncbi:34478_t:CDS:1 [Gigaspora margarita]|uniref:34478_t:CDS:1 n=1 Tax=Gigaspora margarita TaxID=4874 RepID=A0ABN7VUL2_GIGMA|nr:34478_t:CDS:1 [Gigaspora margarita]
MSGPTNFDTTYPKFGGRLKYYSDEWLESFGNQLATKFVQEGYRPKWDSYPPPLNIHPISFQHYIPNFNAMKSEISHLLEEGIIRHFSTRKRCFLSESSLKRKKNGNYRLVLNLQNLNDYVKHLPVSLEGINLVKGLIRRKDYMVSIDLKDAYYHILLHPDVQKYFVFDFNYERYCFQCLPFGLTTSLWTFKTVLQPIIELIRSIGIRIVVHCDDMLIMSRTMSEAERHGDIVINLLETHGFIINENKSQLTPTRSIEYLRLIINSTTMMFSAPDYKIDELCDECINIYKQRYIPIRILTSLISKLHNIVKDHEYTRELRCDKHLHQGKDQYSLIQLSREGKDELEDWINNIKKWNRYPINAT